MEKKSIHFTDLGLSIQPHCADAMGFLTFREGFEGIDPDRWTLAESLVHAACKHIEEWRESNA